MASPLSLYRDLVETVSLLGAQVIYAQEVGDDHRSNDEIGEEILIAIKFPDVRRSLQRLREAELDRALDAPAATRPAGSGATVLKLRRRGQ